MDTAMDFDANRMSLSLLQLPPTGLVRAFGPKSLHAPSNRRRSCSGSLVLVLFKLLGPLYCLSSLAGDHEAVMIRHPCPLNSRKTTPASFIAARLMAEIAE